jgi:hypothetical protein
LSYPIAKEVDGRKDRKKKLEITPPFLEEEKNFIHVFLG